MSIADLPLLILLAPLAAGTVIGLFGRKLGPKVSHLGVAAEVIAFALSLVLLHEVTITRPTNDTGFALAGRHVVIELVRRSAIRRDVGAYFGD